MELVMMFFLTMLTCTIVGMDELQNSELDYRRTRKQNEVIHEISPNREASRELEAKTIGPFYSDTVCKIDSKNNYQWGEIYQMLREETYPKLPPPQGEENPDARVYQTLKRSSPPQSIHQTNCDALCLGHIIANHPHRH